LEGAMAKTRRVTAKKVAAKKVTAKKVAAGKTSTPRRSEIRDIVEFLPDTSDWKLTAMGYKIRPFYKGADSRPFSCLKAREIIADPPIVKNGKKFMRANEFYLAEECR
jgi:hypothetical protein